MTLLHYFFEAREEILKKNFVGFLVEMMTQKGHFKINWPLLSKAFLKIIHIRENNYFVSMYICRCLCINRYVAACRSSQDNQEARVMIVFGRQIKPCVEWRGHETRKTYMLQFRARVMVYKRWKYGCLGLGRYMHSRFELSWRQTLESMKL